jgi:Kef-type K+ transport system membrane component KefB/mannitol/fructose-specific phosphotransferase system IIA component (Ntr-type)
MGSRPFVMHDINEQNIFLFLVQIFVLLGLARGLGEVFHRWKQPAVTAEILVGIVLGPSILGRFLPSVHGAIFPPDPVQQNMLETVGWLGVLFLLLETGLEIDFSSAWRQKGDALKIAVSDTIVPVGIAIPAFLLLAVFYLIEPQSRILFALFMAAVMTTSAMPVAARALHEVNLSKTDLGFLILSALSVNDIIGWVLFTLVLGFSTQAEAGAGKILMVLGAIAGFTAICLSIGQRLTSIAISGIKRRGMPEPATALTFISLLGALCGAITQRIGIHALFGFFIAGVMAGQARALSERTRQVIAQMVYALFVPIFFVGIGLRIDFLSHFDPFLAIFVSIIGIGSRYLGAWLGTSLTAIPKSDRAAVAVSHTPGGTMEIVFALLALQYGVITQSVFVAIIFAAVLSSVLLGPWLNYSISRRKEVSILEFFHRGSIIPELKAATRDGALRELSELAAIQQHVYDAEDIYEAVLRRENEMGTALEEGLAIPHARPEKLDRSVIVFGRSEAGIEDWNSPDGKPTHFIFLTLTPQHSDVQVQILALIIRTMLRPEIRERIVRADKPEVLWSTFSQVFASQRVLKPVASRSK